MFLQIKECCEKAELIGKSGKPVGGSKKTQGAAAASEPSKGAAPKKVVGGPPKGGPPKGGPPRVSNTENCQKTMRKIGKTN